MNLSKDNKLKCQQLRDRVKDLNINDDFFVTDYNMMRFIKARGTMDESEAMFRKFIAWRAENDMDNASLWHVPKDIKDSFPYTICGLSREEGIVFCVNIKNWNHQTASGRYEEIIKCAYQELEYIMRIIRYYAVKNDRFSKMVFLINLDGMSFAHVSTIEWIRALRTLLRSLEANYPDSLKVCYLLNAPWVFSTLWAIIKPFISPASHKRIKFLGADKAVWKAKITEFVDEDQFPEKFGGTGSNNSEIALVDGNVIRRNRAPDSDNK